MKFSTRTEYGLKAMVNLAKENKAKSIKMIASEESVSVKYLERLFSVLRNQGLVKSFKGTKGGYILNKPANQISVADLVIILEGPIAPMKCVTAKCHLEKKCSSKIVWKLLGDQIEKTLKKIKLTDLI